MASTAPPPASGGGKTLIVCCDGTWVNAAGKDGRSSPPTNVSRMIRALRPTTATGQPQIVLYHAGVGSSGQLLDTSMGGAFGMGLDQDIRDLYQFLCLNYVGGDRMVLVGFSRGAFTARSVADLVASVGLLTAGKGLDRFYDIFEDYENMADEHRSADKFVCPAGTLEAYGGQKGEAWIQWENRRKTQYRAWLKGEGYTHDTYATQGGDGGNNQETEIKITAVAVWDTVGSLGIPAVPILGLQGSAQQWKFTNTQISAKVEHAFQALALDEPRYDFLPSLWERLPGNTTTQLRQVWFPGSHSNAGGGWSDQQLANLTLAWMCDQLGTMQTPGGGGGGGGAIAFDEARLAAIFRDGLRYNAAHPFPFVPVNRALALFSSARDKIPLPWGGRGFLLDSTTTGPPTGAAGSSSSIVRDAADCPGKYAHPHPDGATTQDLWSRGARPWALGQTRMPPSLLQRAVGTVVRKPAQFVRMDPATNDAQPDQPLLNTNEHIHASVRVRLACGGLDMDDKHAWTCEGLTGRKAGDKDGGRGGGHGGHDGNESDDSVHGEDGTAPLWRLERVDGVADVQGMGGDSANEDPEMYYPISKVAGAGRWQWVFVGGGGHTETGGSSKTNRGDDRHSNNQMPTRGPAVRVLPEALPTGRWERLLLGLTVGKPDVLAWAAANPYKRG